MRSHASLSLKTLRFLTLTASCPTRRTKRESGRVWGQQLVVRGQLHLPSGKLVMRVARVGPKRARCLNWKGTSFYVVLELEHVKPVDQRSAIRKADAVLPAFARAGQRHDTLKRVAQRGRCRLFYFYSG